MSKASEFFFVDLKQPKESKTNKLPQIPKESTSSENINNSPQQINLYFEDVKFSSNFDSGNLMKVEQSYSNKSHFLLWACPDCYKTPFEKRYRTWFYFKVYSENEKSLTLTIKNLNNQTKLFKEGHAPVFKSNLTNTWQRVTSQITYQYQETELEICFNFTFQKNEEVYFAFTYPLSYSDCHKFFEEMENKAKNTKQIYFHRETLIFSNEKRNVDLVTITSFKHITDCKEKTLPGLFPIKKQRPYIFENKKYVFISARVHPGEVPSSHILNGFVKQLIENYYEPSIKSLLDNFVFVFVPLINPDGVYRGHYRVDTLGNNLNRFYNNPSITEQPSVFAIKEYIIYLSPRLFMYIDLHAHASKKGSFIFGNSQKFQNLLQNYLFAKLISLNCQEFDYEACNFSEKNMYLKDKGDIHSKEGSGRVSLFKATNLTHCYTLECNYNKSKYFNVLAEKTKKDEKTTSNEDEILSIISNRSPGNTNNQNYYNWNKVERFLIENFENISKGILSAILDFSELNPESRLPNTTFKNTKNLKYWIAYDLLKQAPFRFEPSFRKMQKNFSSQNIKLMKSTLQTLQNFLEKNEKIVLENLEIDIVKSTKVIKKKIIPSTTKENKRISFSNNLSKNNIKKIEKPQIKQEKLFVEHENGQIKIKRNLKRVVTRNKSENKEDCLKVKNIKRSVTTNPKKKKTLVL